MQPIRLLDLQILFPLGSETRVSRRCTQAKYEGYTCPDYKFKGALFSGRLSSTASTSSIMIGN